MKRDIIFNKSYKFMKNGGKMSREIVNKYIEQISKEYQTGSATEHSYRGHLKDLVESCDENIIAINEPKRIKAGAPDYLIATKQDHIEIGHIEAKDIGKDINHKSYTEQFTRYRKGLENLIITDYMIFQFYKNGELYSTVDIAELKNGKIIPINENMEEFLNLIKDFTSFVGQTITSPSKLAKMMASKAKLMADMMHKSLANDIEEDVHSELRSQYTVFKEMLIHDMTEKDFADMYAQTITYGMFTARFHDTTLDTFTRQEASELVPHSNPFLRKLFHQIAGYDLDTRISWMVDSLVNIFKATDVKKLLENFGVSTQRNDPIIHFYEEFLAEFDPKLRKSRGVWYTPEPVVKFIVRAVDEVLINEFNLPKGLSDTSKTKIKVDTDQRDARSKTGYKQIEKEVHKVQVLDPATGTGTFLAETIKFVHEKKQYFKWSNYVEKDLLPRLHGFEIVMASYAMAHLKLDLLLKLTGYTPQSKQRLKVFLTNSLEEHHEETGNLFASFLATESQEADKVKKDTPVMCVMGNPPYSGHSSNKNDYIDKLIEDYKKEWDGSKLKERNPKWLNDDYVKFIRYSESYIQKNEEGILGFITNNSYINNPTFRGMRYHLLKTFDKIYIVDLHGDSKKKEVCPDGSKDENVFDIMQGVSIIIGVKKKTKSKKLADLYLCNIFGKRDFKYEVLNENSLKSLAFEKVKYREPNFYFENKNDKVETIYLNSIDLNSLFPVNGVGITTAHDKFVIDENKNILIDRYIEFKNSKPIAKELHDIFNVKEKKGWNILDGWNNLQKIENIEELIHPISYRLFDDKYIIYEDKLVWRTTRQVGKHFINKKDNIGLVVPRQCQSDWRYVFISNKIIEFNLTSTAGKFGSGGLFPLYLYQDENSLDNERTPNLNLEIVKEIEEKLKLTFTNEKEDTKDTFAPIDILDYIYAVLHSPNYRETYKEFLKIDFPRVPYPDIKTFWELVAKGSELRSYHLLENPKIYEIVISLNDSENNTIERKIVKKDAEINGDVVKLWLNDNQFIDNIPLIAWNFYIGGYQPAQKWLKDRTGREMREEDYEHYNKIIVALMETDRIMKEIDKIIK